jgi:hypothetical protein
MKTKIKSPVFTSSTRDPIKTTIEPPVTANRARSPKTEIPDKRDLQMNRKTPHIA